MPYCELCKHLEIEYHPEADKPQILMSCKSFPNGIPLEILDRQYDHRFPHPFDHGLRFEKRSAPPTLEARYESAYVSLIEELDQGRKAGRVLPPDTGSPEGNFLALLRLYRVTEAELDPKKHGYPPLWGIEDADPPLDFRLLFVLILDAYSKLDAETMARYPLPDFDVYDYEDDFERDSTES